RGELCNNFLGCFTCPNAIIAADPASLSKLLQARDHLRGAAATVHPVRWDALYAPQLRILEEDILTRFAATELSAAARLQTTLPPLPDLR
ncbi:MAG: site-specific integrase, partial [Steroidobacteraceae bacterium]